MDEAGGITFILARNLVDAINKVGEGHALFASRFYLINEYLTFYEEDLLRGDFSDKGYLEKRGRTASFHFLSRALELGDKEMEALLFDSVVFEDKERNVVSMWYYDKDFSYPHIYVFSSSSFIYTLDLIVREITSLKSIRQDFKDRFLDYILGFKESITGDIVSFSSATSSGYEMNSKRQYEYPSDVFLNKLKNIFDLILTDSSERVYSLVDGLLKHNISFSENIVSSLRVASDKQAAYDYKEAPVFYFIRVEDSSYRDKSPLFLESYYVEGDKVHLWAVPTYGELTPKELKEGYFYLSIDVEKLPFSGKFVIIPLHLSTEYGNFVLLFLFKVMRIGDNLGEAYEFGSSFPLSNELEGKIGHLGRYIKTCSFRRPKGDERKAEEVNLSLFLDYFVSVFLSYEFTGNFRDRGFYDLSSNFYLSAKDFVIDATVRESWDEVYINGFRSREGTCFTSIPKFSVNGKKAFRLSSNSDKGETKNTCTIARRYLEEVLDVFEEDFMGREGLEPVLIARSVYDGGLGLILGDQGFSNEKGRKIKYALDLSYFSVRALIDSVRTIIENEEIFYRSCYYRYINLFGDLNKRHFSVSKVSLNFDSDIHVTTDFSHLIKSIEECKSLDKKVFDVDTSLFFGNREDCLNIPIYSLSWLFRERYLRNLLQIVFEVNKMKILDSLGLPGEEMGEEDKAKVAIASLFLSGIPSDQRLFGALISTNLGTVVGILDYFGKVIDFRSIGKGAEFNISAKYTLSLDIRRKIDEEKENSTLSTVVVEFLPFRIDNDKVLPMIVNAIEIREGEFVTMAYLSNFQELVKKPKSRF
jgi:hypothetical protein